MQRKQAFRGPPSNVRNRGVRAQIRQKGHAPLSQTFETKSLAATWVKQMEGEIAAGRRTDFRVARKLTVATLLSDYKAAVSPSKQDISRIQLLGKALGKYSREELHSSHCLEFVDQRRGSQKQRLDALHPVGSPPSCSQ